MRRLAFSLALALTAAPLGAATRLLVTVVDAQSGELVTGLAAGDFTVTDNQARVPVKSAELATGPLDILLLLDTSLAGPVVRPVVENFVRQLRGNEQMAVVAVDSSADLIQDFTSSRGLILRSVSGVKYGNPPHLVDALYAAVDTGFSHSVVRRVVLLLTAGLEGNSRTTPIEVIRLARRNHVSLYPVYVAERGRSLLEPLARETGGASFNLRDMKKVRDDDPAPHVFKVLRSPYTLTLGGAVGLADQIKVNVKRPGRLRISALPLE